MIEQFEITQFDLDSVTSHEIDLWLFAIAGFDHTLTQSCRDQYVQGWNVRRKIAVSKKTGEWLQILRRLSWLPKLANSLDIAKAAA